jgi:hypothetical protein
VFLTQNKAKLCKLLIITFDLGKKRQFFSENWEKSLKIVIVTSTPGQKTGRIRMYPRGNRAQSLGWKDIRDQDFSNYLYLIKK